MYTFEVRTLICIIDILRKAHISPSEMFSSCDESGDGQVDIKEMLKFLHGLDPRIKKK